MLSPRLPASRRRQISCLACCLTSQAELLQQLWHEFESLATPESRYCKSIDRLMPLLINYETFGLSWRENNVDDVMVQEIVERIKPGSLALYQHAVAMKERAVELGYLYKHGE